MGPDAGAGAGGASAGSNGASSGGAAPPPAAPPQGSGQASPAPAGGGQQAGGAPPPRTDSFHEWDDTVDGKTVRRKAPLSSLVTAFRREQAINQRQSRLNERESQ